MTIEGLSGENGVISQPGNIAKKRGMKFELSGGIDFIE